MANSGTEDGLHQPIRVLLIDDHRMLLDTLSTAIAAQDDLVVVGTASTVEDGLAAAKRLSPEVILLDLRLDEHDTVAFIPALTALRPTPKVVVLSAARDGRNATRAVEAGAAGYLTKQQPLHELLAGIRSVVRGHAALDPDLLGGVLNRLARPDPSELTRREIEVLHRLAKGHDASKIADEMHIARNTLRNHVQRILTKLGASSRLEAVAIARRDGLLTES
jgi:DNA-binding NarL/FixJ family response regulator